MKRACSVLSSVCLVASANAEGKHADERFFDAFLPLMIGVGVVIVLIVVIANVVAARRRMLRAMSPPFNPAYGTGFGQAVPPRTVSKTTTTTSADGSVTVTVVEETSVSSGTPFGINGVVDPELFASGAVNGGLEQEILTEVRDAFRRMNDPQKDVR